MNTFWWIVIVLVAVVVSNIVTVFLCRSFHLQSKERQRNFFVLTLFGMNWVRIKQNGFFDSQKFYRESVCALNLVGLNFRDLEIDQGDFSQIEKIGSDRLCQEILQCFENFFDTHELSQSIEFFEFYDIVEHGGPNEHTFADLEMILRERLEDIGKTLGDFSEDENSLSHYRDWWKTWGILYRPYNNLRSELLV